MTPTPPSPVPPRLDDLPAAILSAELRRGSMVRCGPGVRLVSWPDTPSVRAAAIAAYLVDGRIAAHLTAAWIWLAAHDPGTPLRFIVTGGRSHDLPRSRDIRLHEYRLRAGDVVSLGGLAVTSPERTLYDLLRASGFDRTHRIAARVLLAYRSAGRRAFLASLPATRRPYDSLVRQRLIDA